LDAADDDLPGLVELRLGREKELARDRRRLLAELAGVEAERLAGKADSVISAHWEDRDLSFLKDVGNRLVELAPRCVALLTAGRDGDGCFLVAAGPGSGLDLAVAGPEVCEILDGRGGGKAPFFQGKASSVGRRDRAADRLAARDQPRA